MIIHRFPYAAIPGSDDELTLERAGETLTINGAALDLSVIPDGASVEDAGDLHPYLRGSIERIDGVLHVRVRLPYHDRSGHVPAPPPIIDPPDGPIALPVIKPDHQEA